MIMSGEPTWDSDFIQADPRRVRDETGERASRPRDDDMKMQDRETRP
jgi:hypothetical protein